MVIAYMLCVQTKWKELSMSTSDESRLPQPGKVYQIPEGTHADLDLQDDKELVFYRRSTLKRFAYFRTRR